MSPKLKDKELERHEAGRDVWKEVVDAVDEIKAGGGKRYTPYGPVPIFCLISATTISRIAERS